VVAIPYREFFSQSGVLHLAQGFGKAVVATDVGGLPEVVENGVTGMIVPAGDIERLGKAIFYLLENEEVRGKLGTTARVRAAEKFGWDGIAEATIQYAYGLELETGKDAKKKTEARVSCVG
jgi:glycosyltransferase involved in cell wall biosynthesis